VLARGLIRDNPQAHLALARVGEQPPSSTPTWLPVRTSSDSAAFARASTTALAGEGRAAGIARTTKSANTTARTPRDRRTLAAIHHISHSPSARPRNPLHVDGRQPVRRAIWHPQWARRESAPTPKAGLCRLGTMRKLATQKISFHSAAIIASRRTAHLSWAESATLIRHTVEGGWRRRLVRAFRA
jgi:hypothetical protein